MEQFYLGADISKGYSDFILIDKHKQPVDKNFQLDDTAAGHVQLYELDWPHAAIELQLDHVHGDKVSTAYNHAEHLEVRTKMMQGWGGLP